MRKTILSLIMSIIGIIMMDAQSMSFDFIVAKDGSGTHTTLQGAINDVPDYRKKETRIFISEGVYHEKIAIPESKQNISLIGEKEGKVVVEFDDFAQKKNSFGEEKGTSGSASFYVYGHDFHATNIVFANTAGPVGQAVAMFVSGNRAIFNNCRFKGFQDTLYTYGKQSKQLYKNCYIEGTVDFIFGSSTAYFLNCKIHCLRNGYITAASTPENAKYGYVFRYCTITAEKEVTEGVFLGRPWRPYAKTVFIECTMGKFINSEGWNNWGSTEKEKTVTYGEADSYDFDGNIIDLSKRAAWAKAVNPDDYAIDKVLADNDKPEWYK